MEDYKKKYEETIERIKEMYLSQPDNCEFTAPFEKAFPEAKEWEEEKTKADILRFINSHLAGFDVREKYVNWIEKHSKDMYHEWTIADARAGDVLAYKDEIVIFERNNYNPKTQNGCMSVYCSVTMTGNYWCKIGGINPTNFHPATKEERDLLFKKMKEDGYEWDAEKKELKEIEGEPTELLKGEDYQTDDGILEHKIAIDTVKALCENQGSSWTAEDNVMYDKCLMALSNWRDSVKSFGKDTTHCQEIIDWLRSKINGC